MFGGVSDIDLLPQTDWPGDFTVYPADLLCENRVFGQLDFFSEGVQQFEVLKRIQLRGLVLEQQRDFHPDASHFHQDGPATVLP